jgi:hypothetical protein
MHVSRCIRRAWPGATGWVAWARHARITVHPPGMARRYRAGGMGAACTHHGASAGHGPALPGGWHGRGMHASRCIRRAWPGATGWVAWARHARITVHPPGMAWRYRVGGMGAACTHHGASAGHGLALPGGWQGRGMHASRWFFAPCADQGRPLPTARTGRPPVDPRHAWMVGAAKKQRPGKSRAFAGKPWPQPWLTRSPPASRRCATSAYPACTGRPR